MSISMIRGGMSMLWALRPQTLYCLDDGSPNLISDRSTCHIWKLGVLSQRPIARHAVDQSRSVARSDHWCAQAPLALLQTTYVCMTVSCPVTPLFADTSTGGGRGWAWEKEAQRSRAWEPSWCGNHPAPRLSIILSLQ